MRSHRKTDTRDNKRDEVRWAKGVKERDGYRCRMERWSGKRRRWEEHGIAGAHDNPLFSAHIYNRHLIEPIKFQEIVGITACLACHDRYDLRSFKGPAVQVPEAREEDAYRLINLAITKWHVPRKKPSKRPPPRVEAA